MGVALPKFKSPFMRKKILLFAIPLVAGLMYLQSCTKTEQVALKLPTIDSFTPTSGLPGSTVTITGTNFDATATNNLVTIGGLQATVTDGSATSLTATVPASAVTGTSAKITVTALGLTAVSADNFSVTAVPPVATTKVTGDIATDTHWTADQHYLLSGYVYVTSGHTLTIDAGTIIKGDKATKGALIIEQGAKIIAIGTAAKPIVFTSNQPQGQRNYGDWGGVILCGKAPVNWTAAPKTDGTTGTVPAGFGQIEGGPRSLYGGTDLHDNSGTLQYIRIEFGGVAFSQDNEINGLTLGGVGDGTIIDHIQISYAGDDSIEWFGGSVNGKYLIAHRGLDDDFDTDNGFSGKIQYAVGLRDPNVADQSGSKGFESDSYQSSTNKTQPTTAVFSNVTIIGGVVNPNSTAYDPQFVSALQNRKGSEQKYYNCVFAAYPAGILISNETGVTSGDTYVANNKSLVDVITIKSCLFGGIPTNQTKTMYGIAPVNGAPTANFDKNVVIVTNNTRSRTPTYEVSGTTTATSTKSSIAPYVDSVFFSTWFQSQAGGTNYTGPYSWLGSSISRNTAMNNIFVYTEQTGIRLVNPFTLTNPSFFPSSSSPITVGVTGAPPKMVPDFTGAAADSFFDKVDYIGAFKFGGTDWTLQWTNWDPNNADYGAAY